MRVVLIESSSEIRSFITPDVFILFNELSGIFVRLLVDKSRDTILEGSLNEKNITVFCNLKRFNFNNEQKNRHIMQYSIHYEPLIAEDNYPLKRTLIRQLKDDLEGIFEKYFQAGDTLFICSHDSPEQISLEKRINELLEIQELLNQEKDESLLSELEQDKNKLLNDV